MFSDLDGVIEKLHFWNAFTIEYEFLVPISFAEKKTITKDYQERKDFH